MKVFLDANVLVTVLCNEYPRFSACARVLSLADDQRFQVYTSPMCLAIGAYFAAKKNGKAMARKKVAVLAERLKVTTVDQQAVTRAMTNKRITDIEDGFQYYSAIDAKCTCIITYDKRDFLFSDIEVLDPEQFLLKHVVPKRTK
jgi:predicted nucleic acid-binding protein